MYSEGMFLLQKAIRNKLQLEIQQVKGEETLSQSRPIKHFQPVYSYRN